MENNSPNIWIFYIRPFVVNSTIFVFLFVNFFYPNVFVFVFQLRYICIPICILKMNLSHTGDMWHTTLDMQCGKNGFLFIFENTRLNVYICFCIRPFLLTLIICIWICPFLSTQIYFFLVFILDMETVPIGICII